MKNVLISRTQIYANPVVSLPHTRVVKGEIFELDDALADIIVDMGGGEIADSVDEKEVVSHETHTKTDNDIAWAGDAIAALVKNQSQRELKAACNEMELDTDGTKRELAKKLVSVGVTEINK